MNNEYLLHYDKETFNKFRWATTIDGVPFTFYIPQWRVPDPAPSAIKISLFSAPLPESKPTITPELTVGNPKLRNLPIVSFVKLYSEHSKTVRYDPAGDQSTWEIGSPYIPSSLLKDTNADTVLICVQWA